MHYALIAFDLLNFKKSWQAWRNVNFVVFLVAVVLIVAGKVMVKSKTTKESKEGNVMVKEEEEKKEKKEKKVPVLAPTAPPKVEKEVAEEVRPTLLIPLKKLESEEEDYVKVEQQEVIKEE